MSVIRETLTDVVQQIAPLFTKVRVITDDAETNLSSYLDDRTLLVIGRLKNTIPDFNGDFGIQDLGMLKGLLNLPIYKGEDAKLTIHRGLNAMISTMFLNLSYVMPMVEKAVSRQ